MIARLLFALLCLITGSGAIGETRYANSSGIRIAFEVRGSGDPLVLIPGFSQSRAAWDHAGLADAFVQSGRQVILVDPRGHGASDKPVDPTGYSSQAVAGDIVAVLDELGIQTADLLGYSRGGWIAIVTAIEHPARVRSVIGGGAHPYAEDLGPFRTAVAGSLAEWVTLIESRVGRLPPTARAMFFDNDVEALRAAVLANRRDNAEALAATGIPVLLYTGSEDPRADMARRFADAHPYAEFVEIPGKDHFQAFFAARPIVEAVNSERSQ